MIFDIFHLDFIGSMLVSGHGNNLFVDAIWFIDKIYSYIWDALSLNNNDKSPPIPLIIIVIYSIFAITKAYWNNDLKSLFSIKSNSYIIVLPFMYMASYVLFTKTTLLVVQFEPVIHQETHQISYNTQNIEVLEVYENLPRMITVPFSLVSKYIYGVPSYPPTPPTIPIQKGSIFSRSINGGPGVYLGSVLNLDPDTQTSSGLITAADIKNARKFIDLINQGDFRCNETLNELGVDCTQAPPTTKTMRAFLGSLVSRVAINDRMITNETMSKGNDEKNLITGVETGVINIFGDDQTEYHFWGAGFWDAAQKFLTSDGDSELEGIPGLGLKVSKAINMAKTSWKNQVSETNILAMQAYVPPPAALETTPEDLALKCAAIFRALPGGDLPNINPYFEKAIPQDFEYLDDMLGSYSECEEASANLRLRKNQAINFYNEQYTNLKPKYYTYPVKIETDEYFDLNFSATNLIPKSPKIDFKKSSTSTNQEKSDLTNQEKSDLTKKTNQEKSDLTKKRLERNKYVSQFFTKNGQLKSDLSQPLPDGNKDWAIETILSMITLNDISTTKDTHSATISPAIDTRNEIHKILFPTSATTTPPIIPTTIDYLNNKITSLTEKTNKTPEEQTKLIRLLQKRYIYGKSTNPTSTVAKYANSISTQAIQKAIETAYIYLKLTDFLKSPHPTTNPTTTPDKDLATEWKAFVKEMTKSTDKTGDTSAESTPTISTIWPKSEEYKHHAQSDLFKSIVTKTESSSFFLKEKPSSDLDIYTTAARFITTHSRFKYDTIAPRILSAQLIPAKRIAQDFLGYLVNSNIISKNNSNNPEYTLNDNVVRDSIEYHVTSEISKNNLLTRPLIILTDPKSLKKMEYTGPLFDFQMFYSNPGLAIVALDLMALKTMNVSTSGDKGPTANKFAVLKAAFMKVMGIKHDENERLKAIIKAAKDQDVLEQVFEYITNIKSLGEYAQDFVFSAPIGVANSLNDIDVIDYATTTIVDSSLGFIDLVTTGDYSFLKRSKSGIEPKWGEGERTMPAEIEYSIPLASSYASSITSPDKDYGPNYLNSNPEFIIPPTLLSYSSNMRIRGYSNLLDAYKATLFPESFINDQNIEAMLKSGDKYVSESEPNQRKLKWQLYQMLASADDHVSDNLHSSFATLYTTRIQDANAYSDEVLNKFLNGMLSASMVVGGAAGLGGKASLALSKRLTQKAIENFTKAKAQLAIKKRFSDALSTARNQIYRPALNPKPPGMAKWGASMAKTYISAKAMEALTWVVGTYKYQFFAIIVLQIIVFFISIFSLLLLLGSLFRAAIMPMLRSFWSLAVGMAKAIKSLITTEQNITKMFTELFENNLIASIKVLAISTTQLVLISIAFKLILEFILVKFFSPIYEYLLVNFGAENFFNTIMAMSVVLATIGTLFVFNILAKILHIQKT